MATRNDRVDEAARAARRRLREVTADIRAARRAAGLSQAQVAGAVGCSRQLIGHVEAGRVADPGPILLARVAATVGLDLSLRAFPGGSPLRDAGQLGVLRRLAAALPPVWTLRTEVPVGRGDRRAFDAVLSRGADRVAVECITRLTDAQAQVRAILLKADASRIRPVILVLSDTRWNRAAVRYADPTLRAAFPLGRRTVLAALRAGAAPNGNGVLLI